ncbi:MAG: cytochrome P450 [Actinomycetales bacterium]|nr:cytochrome P450 [Actinomycetales bacterium]
MPEIVGSLLEPETAACPWAFYAQLRANAPVYRMPETGFYIVSRYEDLKAIASDPQTFSNSIVHEQYTGESGSHLGRMYEERLSEIGWGHVQTLHRTDPPEHGRYRRLLNRALSPARVEGMVPSVERLTDQLIDAFADRGECDFVAEFAFPLPGLVIAEQLGLDATQITTFKRWADAMLAPAQGLLTDEDAVIHYSDIEAEAQHYLADVLEERRSKPTDDWMSALVADPEDGDEPYSMHELQNLMHQLVTGGYTTTADALANAMLLLIEHPDQMDLLRRDRTLLRNFADEALRHSSSVQGLFRRATRDVELGGVPIPANAILHIRYGAANRDEDVFDDPDRFDITRDNAGKHIGFSRGPHFCVGRPLALQEMMIAFDRILDRLDDIALAPGTTLERAPGFFLYSLLSLPITFTRR